MRRVPFRPKREIWRAIDALDAGKSDEARSILFQLVGPHMRRIYRKAKGSDEFDYD